MPNESPIERCSFSRLGRPHEAMPFSEKGEEDGVLTHSTNASSESNRYDDGKTKQRKKEVRPDILRRLFFFQKLKIIFPHVALTVLLFAYMTGGAATLQWLENREALADGGHSLADHSSQPEVLISRAVEKAANICASSSPPNHCDHTVGEISTLLSRAADSCQKLPYAAAQLPYWSFRMSFLYILTVVTTTGYDQVSPATTSGRWFSMLYGLIGIPLMLLTIANFGVFLSESVMLIAKWFRSFMRSAKWRLQRLRAKPNVDRRDVYHTEGNLKQQQQPAMAVPAKRGKRRRLSHILFFIAFAYIGLVLFYCFISSHIFMLFERQWSTVAGMFFSFNTITTIGLGNMRLDSDLYVLFVILHNMVGLAMLTMCVNLASTYFKLLFLKLHYFGRKMRRFRSALDTMSGEMVEAMRIVLKLMKIKANKGSITIDDIQELLEAVKDIHVEPRRAFTPNDVSCIPFADD
ncbi:potassium channels protein 7, TWiK family [Trichuris trichiura]|uniref:Potassium channels protein 7, TWiK family n=1 Tax=Trichuris trichiura TaxID=36087 RepID=A0A077YW62_TRITR|nr:potassium channels protein 7, TWiK family [Trichuris trichiura]